MGPWVCQGGQQMVSNSARNLDVRFSNNDVTLSGTLVLPKASGPHPAVVFIHGSGPQTREGVKFFADRFASHGIAGLVYDKRGVGDSTGEFPDDRISSFDDLADDAIAGQLFLKQRSDIDAARIGFWGFSQGGWLAPLAATRSNGTAFVICVGGPGVDGESQMQYAIPNLMRADGFTEEEIDETLKDRAYLHNLLHEIAVSGDGWDELETQVDRIKKTGLPIYVGIPETKCQDIRAAINVEAWRSERSAAERHDPYAVLARLTCPVLSIYGECDANVPVAMSVEVYRAALEEVGNADYTIKVFPEANHGVRVDGELAEGYLDFMTSWLVDRLY